MKTRLLIGVEVVLLFVAIFVSSRVFDFSILATTRNQLISTVLGKPVCKDCNVILISLDTLSANHLPCYGYERNTAPNLCKFGKDNIMFTNMFANANYTLPSHVSIFTGLYPSQHKVSVPNRDSLSSSIPFLPEILQNNGYKTYFYMSLISSNLPVDRVYNRGIDSLIEGDSPEMWKRGLNTLNENNLLGKKTFLFLHTWWLAFPYIKEGSSGGKFIQNTIINPKLQASTKEGSPCTEDFMKFLYKSIKSDLDNNYWDGEKKRVYLQIYSDLTNLINTTPQSLGSLCDNDEYLQYSMSYLYNYRMSEVDKTNIEEISYLIDSYDSKIKELDVYIQEVIDFVTTSQLGKNTIIIFTSDHGEEFMEHGAMGHGSNLYDTTLKVPLMMYIPGESNKRITQLSQSVDIVPTLLKILNIPQNFKSSGVDLLSPIIIPVNTRYGHEDDDYSQQIMGVVRDNQWKLHYIKNGDRSVPLELYDISKDSQEKQNVIYTNTGVVNRLLKNNID